MSKGEQTREAILKKAAPVFNRQGYAGASMSDIMAATGLEKGGIYNHFGSKDQLALEAFDYAFELVSQQLRAGLQGKTHSVDRLLVMAELMRNQADDTPLPGGCPILNTAVEADDTHPALRERARNAMNNWMGFIRRNVTRGIERGEVRADTDAEQVATVVIAALEGAVMLTKLFGDPNYMNRAVDHVTTYIESIRLK